MVTEFTDHICVTMDAELIMFLHDLVSAYLKEKEKGEIMKSRLVFSFFMNVLSEHVLVLQLSTPRASSHLDLVKRAPPRSRMKRHQRRRIMKRW